MTKRGLLLAALAGVVLAALLLPVSEWISLFFAWSEANPQIAWGVFSLFYIAAVVLLLPGSLLTLGAGYLFGLGYGFAVVSFSSTVGASLAFLLGRFVARAWVDSKLASMPRFAALDRAIGDRAAIAVLLIRLSPVFPFNLINYAMGLTKVRFSTFVLFSWLGMMPGTILYVYVGSIAQDLTTLFSGDLDAGAAGNWLFYAGLVATLILTVGLTRVAGNALNQQLEEPHQSSTPQPIAEEKA